MRFRGAKTSAGQTRRPHRVALELICSLVNRDTEAASAILEGDHDDIRHLCGLLVRWRLAGYVHTLIADTGFDRKVMPEARDLLAESYRQQVQKAEVSLRLLEDVKRVMEQASVPFLILKGFYLAQRFFGDIRRRFMWDIDILVQGADLGKAIVAIEGTGLRIPSGARYDFTNRFWGIHAIEARGKPGKVDIHHVIRNLPKIQFDHERIWNRARPVTINESQYLTLSDEDTLLAAAIGLGADIQTGHHRIRKILDVCTMLRALDANTDWPAFFALREQEASLKLTLNVFHFCMLLARSHDDSPRLRRAMAPYDHLLLISDENQADEIYCRGKQHVANRVLFSRLLPGSALYYWVNWMITVPVRTWHFR